MKTKWIIIPVIAITFGCTREIDTKVTYVDGELTFYATSGENETRTVLQQDGRVFWSPSDCITVFYGNIPGKFTSTNSEPAASAEFTGYLGSFALDGDTEFRAIYPHSDNLVMPTDEGILSIYLPSEQTGVEGTFADDLFICVAKSRDNNLHFYNVCGGVKFSLARDDIKKVVFRGNNGETLAGRLGVEFGSDGKPVVTKTTADRSSVTLEAPDGGTFKANSYYYLVSIPQELSKGYTLDLYTDELVETIKSESSVSIIRSAWGVLKGLGTSSEPIDVEGVVDLGLPSGLLWAACNLGASKPEEYGDYYAWGEIWPKDEYTWETYKWCEGDDHSLTKYCYSSDYGYLGFRDDKRSLKLEDDAAYVNLGKTWLIPKPNDYSELISKCTWKWTQKRGVNGFSVTGPNGNSIFLPAAGYCFKDGLIHGENKAAQYATNTVSDIYPNDSYCLYLTRNDKNESESYYHLSSYVARYEGNSIRPIYFIPIESVSIDKVEVEISNFQKSAILRAKVSPEDAMNKRFTWDVDGLVSISPDNDICTVAFNWTAGATEVTVIAENGRTEAKTASCRVVSKIYITDARFVNMENGHYSSLTSVDLLPGEGYTLTPAYYPEDATEFTMPYGWKSDDPSIATVTNGKVIGVKEGTTTIFVQYRSWNNTIVERGCQINVINPSSSHEGFHNDYWD
jgi:hypothetical protein